MTTGRITFPGNPWPLGHAIEDMTMTLRGGDGDDVRLHLHVQSAPFDANGPGRPPGPGAEAEAWDDPATWVQHGPAILSSLKWGNRGVPVEVDDDLSFDELDLSGTYTADEDLTIGPDEVMEDRAFGAYVLGAAAVADHTITLTRTGPNLFGLRWTGRLARTWLGDDALDHEFVVEARDARLT